MFNLSDRAHVDLHLNCIDTISTVLGRCDFLTYAIISPM